MSLRIAAAEFPPSVDPSRDPAAAGALDDLAARAAAGGADLLLLPEALLPGYRHARADCGPAARDLALRLAARHRLAVCPGFLHGDGCFLGLAAPDGQWSCYRKQHPSPAESRQWRAGRHPGVVPFEARSGRLRLGLLICADLLHLRAWEALRGRADLVLIAAAWPDYRQPPPPGLGWLYAESNRYRDHLLARAAASLGVPVAFANAAGPGFSGGTGLWDSSGARVGSGAFSIATLSPAAPPSGVRPPLRHEGRWRAFMPAYAAAGTLVGHLSHRTLP